MNERAEPDALHEWSAREARSAVQSPRHEDSSKDGESRLDGSGNIVDRHPNIAKRSRAAQASNQIKQAGGRVLHAERRCYAQHCFRSSRCVVRQSVGKQDGVRFRVWQIE